MLTKETVERVSQLGRLKLTEQEIAAMSEQLSVVLENFEKIAQVDTKDVKPLVTPTDMSVTLRPDVIEVNSISDAVLEGAPEKSGRLFKVPPVV
jgi:aspartyl-tRNA(Asn)/glutamyl-tRNA(Gln) amidotransferase subunit C